jgi:hypothetical protein
LQLVTDQRPRSQVGAGGPAIKAYRFILAAMLLPALAKAKEKAHRTSCFNNCRQVMLAAWMYDDQWPNWFYWTSSIGGDEAPQPE